MKINSSVGNRQTQRISTLNVSSDNKKQIPHQESSKNCYTKFGIYPCFINFHGQNNLEKKVTNFTQQVEPLILNGNYDIPKLESIMRESLGENSEPKINLKHFKDIYPSIAISPAMIAYLYAYVEIRQDSETKQCKSVLSEKTMFVDPPKDDSIESKTNCLCSMVHEYTHACQHDDPAKSPQTLLDNYLKTRTLDETTIKTMQAGTIIFKSIERDMLSTLALSLGENQKRLERLENMPIKDLDNKIISVTGMKTQEYLKKIINDYIQRGTRQYGNLDRKYLLQYIKQKSENEMEAYREATKVRKRLSGVDYYTNEDLKETIYSQLLQTAKYTQ